MNGSVDDDDLSHETVFLTFQVTNGSVGDNDLSPFKYILNTNSFILSLNGNLIHTEMIK